MPSYEIKDKEMKRSLNIVLYTMLMGMVYFAIFGAPVGSPLFTGFMRALGANDLVYSIVMALPVLGGAAQIVASYFMEATGCRKGAFLWPGFVQRLAWIPVALVPLMVPSSLHSVRIASVTVLITLSSIGGSVESVAFNSWMGDLVPLDIAGRFFGKRTVISTVAGSIAGILVGVYVDRVNNFTGFAIVFIAGAIFGAGDISTFFFVKHPPMKKNKEHVSMLKVLVLPFQDQTYRKLMLFATVFSFAINFSAPFFNVYMIENLKMNYFMITLSNSIMSGVVTILLVQKWGVICDRFGYKPVTTLCGFGMVTVPLVWFFVTPTNIFMVFIANILAGVFWSGYNLAIFNQSVWSAPVKNRSVYIAGFALLTQAIGTALSYVVGGYFMQYIGPVIDSMKVPFILHTVLNKYQLLFMVSALMRLATVLTLLPMVQEKNAKTVSQMVKGVYGSVLNRLSKAA